MSKKHQKRYPLPLLSAMAARTMVRIGKKKRRTRYPEIELVYNPKDGVFTSLEFICRVVFEKHCRIARLRREG